MKTALKLITAAGIAFGSLGVASAMPMSGLDPAVATAADTIHADNVRWVCPPYRRCFWVGGPYYGRPWGWHRWGWHRGGWHRHW
jgi:hypothetical protein